MCPLLLAHQHGQTAQPVTGGDDLALLRQNEQGERALDLLLSVENTADQIILLVDKGGGQLGGVDLARTHGHELVAVVGEIALDQLLRVVDDTHRSDGVQPQVGPHQQGLGVRVTDTADAAVAVELAQVLLELGAERGIFNGVDLALKSVLLVVDQHTAPAGAQVRVVVHSEEDIQGHVLVRHRAKKASHVSASLS